MSHSSKTPVHLIRIVIAIASTTVIVSFIVYIILMILQPKKPNINGFDPLAPFARSAPFAPFASTKIITFSTKDKTIELRKFKVCQKDPSSDAPVEIKLWLQKYEYDRNGKNRPVEKPKLVANSDIPSGEEGNPKQKNNPSEQKTIPKLTFYSHEFRAKCSYFDYQQNQLPAGFYKLKLTLQNPSDELLNYPKTSPFKVNAPPSLEIDESEKEPHVYHFGELITITGKVYDKNGCDDIYPVRFFVYDKEDDKPERGSCTDKNNGEIKFEYSFKSIKNLGDYKLSAQAKDGSNEKSATSWNVKVIPILKKPIIETSKLYNFGEDVETMIDVEDKNKSDLSNVTCYLSDRKTSQDLQEQKAIFYQLDSTNTKSIYKCNWGKLDLGNYLVRAKVVDISTDINSNSQGSDPSPIDVGLSNTTSSPSPSNTVEGTQPGQTH